jgi:excisionase family DNA binding protein
MTDNNFSKPLLVTIEEAIKLIAVKRTKLYELINDGTIKGKKNGHRYLVLYSSLEKYAHSDSLK